MKTAASWRAGVIAAVASRVVFMTIAWVAAWFFAEGRGALAPDLFLGIWRRWDAVHLLQIAEHGYDPSIADGHATAFFPLYPLAVRALAFIVRDVLLAGMLLNAIASVVAFAYLHRLVAEERSEKTAWNAVLYLAFFPTAVFLVAPYTEALFLAGAIAAFYHARHARWTAVALPAAVAVGSRFAGLFLVSGLAVEFVRQRDFARARVLRAVGALVAAITPFLAYMAYLHAAHGNALLFVQHQREGWGRGFVGPVRAWQATWNAAFGDADTNWLLAWRIELLAVVIGVALVVVAVRKREWGYATFMGTTMAVLISSSWYFSVPRLLLSLFPIPVFLATRVATRPRERDIALIAFVGIATLGVIVYTRSVWFF